MITLRTGISIRFDLLVYSRARLSESAIEDALLFEVADFNSSFADLDLDDVLIAFGSVYLSEAVNGLVEIYGVDERPGFELKNATLVVNVEFDAQVSDSVSGEQFFDDLVFEWEPLYSVNPDAEVIQCRSEISGSQTIPI